MTAAERLADLLAVPADRGLFRRDQRRGRGTYVTGSHFQWTKARYLEMLDVRPPEWVDLPDVYTARKALEWAMVRGRPLPAEPPGGALPSVVGEWDYPFPNPGAWAGDEVPGGWQPANGERRLVIHVPHASVVVPPCLRGDILLDDPALAGEILCMTDALTEELFPVTAHEAERIVAGVSRLVVDVERFPSDRDDAMARCGMGAIHTRTHNGSRLRAAPGEAERQDLMDRYFWSHHDALTMAVGRVRQRLGSAVLVNCHSFSSRPLPHEPCQDLDRPDICIGTDWEQTPLRLIAAVEALCRDHGVTTGRDTPFAGVLIPRAFVGDKSVRAVMIEVNRRLYLNEATGTANSGFDVTRRFLALMLRTIERNANP
jgi:N-formylglutamate deformylase